MISYFGDFAEDDTVLIPFNTFSSDDPSASVTITNLADADIHVHKDGSADEIVTDGATVAINFDGVTGNHLITIDTSAHADYSTGSEYAVRIEGTTVDAGTINAWVGAFSIERAGGVLALVKAGVTLANGAVTDASLAGGLEIVFETDFGTNYNTTRDAWVTNGTDFIGTGWNINKTGYALTTADWNVGKTGYALVADSSAVTIGVVGSVSGNVDGNVSGSVASNLELGPAEVNSEVVDVLFTDTDTEPAQGTPGATISLADKIGFLYKAWRNKSLQNATTYELYNDDTTTVDHKATVSDDTTDAIKGEVVSGP